MTQLTIRSLHDKSSSVRKNCLALLTKLVLTHPYGRMHGGELELSVWQKRLEELEAELKVLDLPDEGEREARRLMEGDGDQDEDEDADEAEAMSVEKDDDEPEEAEEEEEEEEESSDGEGTPKKRKPLKNKKLEALKGDDNKRKPRRSELDLAAQSQTNLLAKVDSDTLQRLRLTKKYYTDAISFIEAIEASMDTVTELLASSVKSEVLEAMEFCKTAKEYKIEAAEVRLASPASRAVDTLTFDHRCFST